jgi:large subunit ribosomal protein L5
MQQPRLREHYEERIAPKLRERFEYKSAMQVPRFDKIVVNMGVGDAVGNPKMLEGALDDLTRITGQKPIVRRARKSISNFKLREGMPIGCSVTLRRARMYEFWDRLISIALPRVRDFRGVSPKGFDGRGNFTLGITEQIIFPEIDYDKVARIRGMNVTIVTTARTDEEGYELLSEMGMPFRRTAQKG